LNLSHGEFITFGKKKLKRRSIFLRMYTNRYYNLDIIVSTYFSGIDRDF
jgi:hypothetical protein